MCSTGAREANTEGSDSVPSMPATSKGFVAGRGRLTRLPSRPAKSGRKLHQTKWAPKREPKNLHEKKGGEKAFFRVVEESFREDGLSESWEGSLCFERGASNQPNKAVFEKGLQAKGRGSANSVISLKVRLKKGITSGIPYVRYLV